MYSDVLGVTVNPMSDVLVTVGAYLALYYAIQGWVNHGDEVIIIEPAYDCYSPQVKMAGGVPVSIPLRLKSSGKDVELSSADLQLDMTELESKFSSKTKMLILNNPQNPTGKLFRRSELEAIAALVEKHNVLVIADEVYEWQVYPGHEMVRFASLPRMHDRTITIGSAGKTFSVTGWKLGWAVAPERLLWPLKCVHQNCVFTCSTPTQEAVARAFEAELEWLKSTPEKSYLKTLMVEELLPKREFMANFLRKAGFKPIIPESGYFMM
uniref:Aminotransferase class I/classII domain-containing protein n=1 Tax=Plectus sambesii TaxID=2011161 RepID=A0A914V6Q5_9BILA